MKDPQRYARAIAEGLDRVFDDPATAEHELDAATARLVVFSDHHKGTRDGADDFLRCERAYAAALGFYLEAGHRLFVLGDVEELWENRPDGVLAAYEDVLRLEGDFHRAGRYERFWGNHDDEWRYGRSVDRRLGRHFQGLTVREGLRLRVTDGGAQLGTLFLVHGHQGTLESDRFAWLSRLVVRYGWRTIQRRLKVSLNTPARDLELREVHDTAMFAWARDHRARPVLIAGHTHRPVFGTSRPDPDELRSLSKIEDELAEARAASPVDTELVGRLHAELQYARAEGRRHGRPPVPVVPPCYFNTGCCSFGDGDVTGLEIADGEIRLVRWPDEDGAPRSRVLARAGLREVLASVAHAAHA